MTLDEIQKMDGRDVDAAIAAQVMGTPVSWVGGIPVVGHGARGEQVAARVYHKSLDACHAAEERLRELGRWDEWLACAEDVARRVQNATSLRYPLKWYMLHATALDRARAILLAVQEGEQA